MDSIAVTKPDMGTLSKEGLVLSPFGALSMAFTEELLARAGFEEGRWPFVPLDLLEEGLLDAPPPPVQPVIQVDLSLVLQAMRQSESRTERTVERIIERIIRLREQGRRGAMPVQTALRGPDRRGMVGPAVQNIKQETIHQAVQNLEQEIVHQAVQSLKRETVHQADQNLKQETVHQTLQSLKRETVHQADQNLKQETVHQTLQSLKRETVHQADQNLRQETVRQTLQSLKRETVHQADQNLKQETVHQTLQSLKQETAHQAIQNLEQETVHHIIQTLNQGASLQAVQDPKQGGIQDTVRTNEPAASAAGSFARQQNFYNTVNQHIQFITNIRQAGLARQLDHPIARQTIPGGVSRRSLELFRQLSLLRKGRRTSSPLFDDLRNGILPSLSAAVWPLDTGAALNLPGWQGRASSEYGFARRDGAHMSPEELSYLRDGVDSVPFDMADADAVIRRSAQRAVRQLSQMHSSQAILLGDLRPTAAERQIAGLRRLVQKSADHSTTWQNRWLSRHGLDYTTPEDGEPAAVSSGGLHMARAFEYAGQTGRGAELRTAFEPSMAGLRQPELSQWDHSGPVEERQRPEIGEKTAMMERASRTRVSRQKARFASEGAAAGQEDYPLTPALRDIRLASGGSRKFEMGRQESLASRRESPALPRESPVSPQKRSISAFLLDGELAHKLEKGDLSEYAAAAAEPLGQDIQGRKAIAQTDSRERSQDPPSKGPRVSSKSAFQTRPTAEAQTISTAERQAALKTAAWGTTLHVERSAARSDQPLTPSSRDVRLTGKNTAGDGMETNSKAYIGASPLIQIVPGAEIAHEASAKESGSLIPADQTSILKNASTFALYTPADELTYQEKSEQGDTPTPVSPKTVGARGPMAQKAQPARQESRFSSPQGQLLTGPAAESAGRAEGFAAPEHTPPAAGTQRHILEAVLRDIRLSTAEQGPFAEGETAQEGQMATPKSQMPPLAEMEYRTQDVDGPSAASQGERPSQQLSHTARTAWNRPVDIRTAQAIQNRFVDWKTLDAMLARQSFSSADQRMQGSFSQGETAQEGQMVIPKTQMPPLAEMEYRSQDVDEPSTASQGERPSHQPAYTAWTAWNRRVDIRTDQAIQNRFVDWKTLGVMLARQGFSSADQRLQGSFAKGEAAQEGQLAAPYAQVPPLAEIEYQTQDVGGPSAVSQVSQGERPSHQPAHRARTAWNRPMDIRTDQAIQNRFVDWKTLDVMPARQGFSSADQRMQGSFSQGEAAQEGQAPYTQVPSLAEIEYQTQNVDGSSAVSQASQGERPSHQPAHTARTAWNRPMNVKAAQGIPNRSVDWKTPDAALAQQSFSGADRWLQKRLAEQMKPAVLIAPNIQAGRSGSRTAVGSGRADTSLSGTDLQSAMAPEPLELAYSNSAQLPEGAPDVPAAQGQTPVRGPMDSDYVRSLPDWAKRFLQEGAPQTREEAVRRMGTAQRLDAGQAMASARNIAALSLPESGAFEWTAPDYRAPAPVEYRERPQRQEQSQPQSTYISDAEIRRTADRVYRIIEDRIRQERHRMGL